MKEHLEDFLQHARESYAGPLPAYVVDEFRAYLACGDFSRGFVHVQCTSCGDAMAVAFSCKVRGRARAAPVGEWQEARPWCAAQSINNGAGSLRRRGKRQLVQFISHPWRRSEFRVARLEIQSGLM